MQPISSLSESTTRCLASSNLDFLVWYSPPSTKSWGILTQATIRAAMWVHKLPSLAREQAQPPQMRGLFEFLSRVIVGSKYCGSSLDNHFLPLSFSFPESVFFENFLSETLPCV